MSDPESTSDMTFCCPGCGEQVCIPRSTLEPSAICPYCSTQFSVESGESLDEPDDERARREMEERHETELDALRIRQISALKRSAYRTRSYAIIASFTCAVLIGQFIFMAVMQVRSFGWNFWAILYLLLTPLCLWGALHFMRKAGELHREAGQTTLPTSSTPPDFTPLSDGSQRWKNLERLG